MILLYKTTILPLLLYASPIWSEKIAAACKEYKTLFKHSCSSNIESCQVLLSVPPIDILSSNINFKLLTKIKLANDLLTAAHESSVLRQKSVANLLGSQLRRFVKLVNNESRSYEWITSTISSKLCGDVDGQLGTTGLGQFAERQLPKPNLPNVKDNLPNFFRQIVPLNLPKFEGTICRIPT